MDGIYYIKPIDNSRWVPPPNPREPRYHATLLIVGTLLVLVGILLAGERFKSREYGYQIESLEREKSELIEANRKLRLEEASLVDPLRIDSIARNELGMTTLSPHQIFRAERVDSGATIVAEQRPAAGLLATPVRGMASSLP